MESRKKRLFSREQVRGCILGGAVGDALGYPVEFLSYEQIRMKYGSRGITGYDLDENGLAEISDDTQMTLFTATGLLFASTRAHTHGVCGYPDYYVRMHYIDWLATQTGGCQGGYGGSWLGWEKRMYVRRAPGDTCLSALKAISMGIDVQNSSKGCGGVMRVAPVAVFNDYCENSEEQIATLAARLAGMTHKHPLGSLPAAALAMIIRRIVLEKCPANFNCLAGLVKKSNRCSPYPNRFREFFHILRGMASGKRKAHCAVTQNSSNSTGTDIRSGGHSESRRGMDSR